MNASARIEARLSELIKKKQRQLQEAESNMNELFADLEKLEARRDNEDLTYEDVQRLDDLQKRKHRTTHQSCSRSRSRSPLSPPPPQGPQATHGPNVRNKRERAPTQPHVQGSSRDTDRSFSPASQRSSNFNFSDDECDKDELDKGSQVSGSDVSDCDLDQFLGEPKKKTKTLDLLPKLAKKVDAWMKSGIQKKEDRQKILDDIPRVGVISLEAPTLNEEIESQLYPKEISRDNFFKLYQTIAGSTISLSASMIQTFKKDILRQAQVQNEVKDNILQSLSNIIKLNSDMYQMMCIGRKHFIVGIYESRTKKALAKVETTQFLFGDDVKSLVDGANSLERLARVMRPRANQQNGGKNLNSQRPNNRGGRGNGNRGRQNGYRNNPRFNNYREDRPGYREGYSRDSYDRYQRYPAKDYYQQSQPQRNNNRKRSRSRNRR